jgi:hypothetical protein
MTTWLGMAALAAALLAPAQEQDNNPIGHLPTAVRPFWEVYWPAKQKDDDEAMARAVRAFRIPAEDALDSLLDYYCNTADSTLPDDLRTLANTMDEVWHGTRFIERVRLVLDMEDKARTARFAAFQLKSDAARRAEIAAEKGTEDDWNIVSRQYRRVADSFELIGDYEACIKALWEQQFIESKVNHQMERAKIFARIIELAAKLPFNEPMAADAATELEALKKLGYDPANPDGGVPPPKEKPSGGAAAPDVPQGQGHGLEAFRSGSAAAATKLVLDSPKKGLAPVVLPSFYPLEDDYIWPYSWIEGTGPASFDTQRSVFLAPTGKQWKLLRDGASFSLDSDVNGTPDVSFTPGSNPQRIEVPLSDGRIWPLMVSVPSDRETMFGIELNYAPEPERARLRFNMGGAMKGEVQGETWLLYDNNMTGVYGDTVDQYGDGFTADPSDERTFFRDPDAVLIGKARVAQPWSPVLPLGESFWRATVTPDGTELTLREMDLEAGAVKLDCATKTPPTHVLIEEVSGALPGVLLNVAPAKKGASVPVPTGTWQFVMGRIESGTKTGMAQVRMYRGHAPTFEVKAGETCTLALGAPYTLRMTPGMGEVESREGETRIRFDSLRVFGRGGEEYALLHNEPLQPEVEIIGPDGKKMGKPVKTMRGDVSLWQEMGEKSLYYPAPLMVSELKGSGYTFRLSQKSHPLLGGPFGPELPESAPKAGGKP